MTSNELTTGCLQRPMLSSGVSVVTPVLNDAIWLRRCVWSVRRQTSTPREHIIVDGGSTDGGLEWASAQPDLRVVRGRAQGVYAAINRGFAEAQGDILCWLNADEQYLPQTLSTVCDTFTAHPRTDLLHGDFLVCAPDGTARAYRREIRARHWYLANGVNYIASCAAFFRHPLYERVGPLDTTVRVVGDKDWYLRAIKLRAHVQHIRRLLGIFVDRGTNISLATDFSAEAEALRLRHGAHGFKPLRVLPRACRLLEKGVTGCLGKRTVRYPFCAPNGSVMTMQQTCPSRWPKNHDPA